MKNWKISSRMQLLAAASMAVMLVLAIANWLSMSHLSAAQDASHQKAQAAGEMKHLAGLGAQLYRVVADTYINRQFDDAAKKWQAVTADIDKSLDFAAKTVGTDANRRGVQAGRDAMTALRKLYTEQYLPLAKQGAKNDEIASVDDQIDKLIDAYDDAFSKVAADLGVAANLASQEFDDMVVQTRWINSLSVLVGGLLLAGLGLAVSRSITQQLGLEPAEASAMARRIAQGDLSPSLYARTARPDSVAAALAEMLGTLEGVVMQVRSGAESVASASAQISQGNMDLSSRTEQQASALQQTAATMDQLGTAVRHNADNATQANQLARGASGVASQGGEVVKQVVETMSGIADSSKRIADIISVIDGIAFQTNILALNAAVEAARAGEQGRGFAVVAGEVRNLAGRSADAAREIKGLITASVERVQAGSVLVNQAGATMTEIVGSIQRVADIVAEITAASEEQSQGVQQVGQAVTQMDNNTQQNAALVEQSAAAAQSLKQQADGLVGVVAMFKLRQTEH